MAKKYYRFFGGFLKSQENWLNKMATGGHRLVRTGISTYEFENCEPGQYQYALEFIGEKSKAEAEDYVQFLRDCGYRVFYKNINLDYSIGKATLRPWANKGGRLATNPGTYNRELLIVERENTGAPFELHTTDEDLRAYRRRLHKVWAWAAAMIALVLLLVFGSLVLGEGSFNSSVRVGYVGNSTRRSITAKYVLFNGFTEKTLHSDGTLDFTAETQDGTLSIAIYSKDKELLFHQEDVGSCSFTIQVPETVRVRITGDNHRGSFSIAD